MFDLCCCFLHSLVQWRLLIPRIDCHSFPLLPSFAFFSYHHALLIISSPLYPLPYYNSSHWHFPYLFLLIGRCWSFIGSNRFQLEDKLKQKTIWKHSPRWSFFLLLLYANSGSHLSWFAHFFPIAPSPVGLFCFFLCWRARTPPPWPMATRCFFLSSLPMRRLFLVLHILSIDIHFRIGHFFMFLFLFHYLPCCNYDRNTYLFIYLYCYKSQQYIEHGHVVATFQNLHDNFRKSGGCILHFQSTNSPSKQLSIKPAWLIILNSSISIDSLHIFVLHPQDIP